MLKHEQLSRGDTHPIDGNLNIEEPFFPMNSNQEQMRDWIRDECFKTYKSYGEALEKQGNKGSLVGSVIKGSLINDLVLGHDYDPNKFYQVTEEGLVELNNDDSRIVAEEAMEDTTDVYEGTEETFESPKTLSDPNGNDWKNRIKASTIRTKKNRTKNKLARTARRNNR